MPRIAFVSDIHANIDALEAVFADIMSGINRALNAISSETGANMIFRNIFIFSEYGRVKVDKEYLLPVIFKQRRKS